MRFIRFFFAITIVCGLGTLARATPVDFHAVIVDPPNPPFNTFGITSSPFTVTFAACGIGQLPSNVVGSYDGCFSGINATKQAITALQIVFPNTSALASQAVGCALDGTADVFTSPTCALLTDQSQYVLNFAGTGGGIPVNGYFVIAEAGVSPDLFPEGTASIVVTPEPGSLLLLSTGVLLIGLSSSPRARRSISFSQV